LKCKGQGQGCEYCEKFQIHSLAMTALQMMQFTLNKGQNEQILERVCLVFLARTARFLVYLLSFAARCQGIF